MEIKNAIRKLEKSGYLVSGSGSTGFRAVKSGLSYVVEFRQNGGGSEEVVCIRVRHVVDIDDSQSDYSAGAWFGNITQAIKFADSHIKTEEEALTI